MFYLGIFCFSFIYKATHYFPCGSFSWSFSNTLTSNFAASRYLSTFLIILSARTWSLQNVLALYFFCSVCNKENQLTCSIPSLWQLSRKFPLQVWPKFYLKVGQFQSISMNKNASRASHIWSSRSRWCPPACSSGDRPHRLGWDRPWPGPCSFRDLRDQRTSSRRPDTPENISVIFSPLYFASSYIFTCSRGRAAPR